MKHRQPRNRHADPDAGQRSQVLPKRLDAVVPGATTQEFSSSGHPLPVTTREVMQARFGHDFSRVRVHTDAQAAVSARNLQAAAYTVGTDIVFAAGRFAPQTPEGRQLLAHELAHVVQQTGTSGTLACSRRETRMDPLEREAQQAAAAVARGDAFRVSGRAGPGIQRLPWDSDALEISLEPRDPKTPPQVYYFENGFLHQRLSSNLPVYQGPFCQNVILPFQVGLEFRVDWSDDPRPQPFTPPELRVVFHLDAPKVGFRIEDRDTHPQYAGAGEPLKTSFPGNYLLMLDENGPLRMTFSLKDPDTGINRVYDDVIQIEAQRPCV